MEDSVDFDYKNCVFAEIRPPISKDDEDLEVLAMYMENMMPDEDILSKLNSSKNWAVIKSNTHVIDINALQRKIEEKPMGTYNVMLKPLPTLNQVIVTGLPPETISDCERFESSEVVLYFESEKFCPKGGDVKDVKCLPCNHGVIVQFVDPAVVKRLPKQHKIVKTEVNVRPFAIFEYVQEPHCDICDLSTCSDEKADEHEIETDEDNSTGEMETDKQSSTKNSFSDNSISDDEDGEGCRGQISTPEQDTNDEESLAHLRKWSDSGANAVTQGGNSSVSGKNPSANYIYTLPNREMFNLFQTTFKSKKFPGLQPQEYDFIKPSRKKSDFYFEIHSHDQETNDRLKKLFDDQGTAEVCLDDYTDVACKLNCSEGKKWVMNLLDDFKLPAVLRTDDTKLLKLQALNLKIAQEAATTVAKSLLPARMQCEKSKVRKCLNSVADKMVVIKEYRSGWLEIVGVPLHVIEAVRLIEQNIYKKPWSPR